MNVMQGTLDMLVLKSLEEGAKHGYGVMAWIGERSDDEFKIGEWEQRVKGGTFKTPMDLFRALGVQFPTTIAGQASVRWSQAAGGYSTFSTKDRPPRSCCVAPQN